MPRIVRSSFIVPPNPKTSFAGKTILITGGNTGLGLEAAIKFLHLDAAKVIITTRDLNKGATAKSLIDSRTKRGDRVEVWNLDMNSYFSIQALAQKASSELKSLDIVILNAGIGPRYFAQSPLGWESALQINTLSNTLLALLLLPKLRASKTDTNIPHLEIVAARAHEDVMLTEEQKNAPNILAEFNVRKEEFVGHKQYIISKLFLIYAMKSLAKMMQGKDGKPEVVVNAVCPGACSSELAREYNGGVLRLLKGVAAKVVLKSAEEGARTYVIGVVKGVESHAGFIQNEDVRPEAKMVAGVEGEKLRVKIWGEILEVLKKDMPNGVVLAGI